MEEAAVARIEQEVPEARPDLGGLDPAAHLAREVTYFHTRAT